MYNGTPNGDYAGSGIPYKTGKLFTIDWVFAMPRSLDREHLTQCEHCAGFLAEQ